DRPVRPRSQAYSDKSKSQPWSPLARPGATAPAVSHPRRWTKTPRQSRCRQSVSDRIAAGGEYDRNRRGCGLRGARRESVADDKHRPPCNHIRREGRQFIELIFSPLELDRDVPALDKASLLQSFAKCRQIFDLRRSSAAVEEPDQRHRLLRVRCQRPRQRTACDLEKFPPFHIFLLAAKPRSIPR